MSLFDFIKQIQQAGTALPLLRGALNFLSPITATDDPANGRVNIAVSVATGTTSGLISAGDQAYLNSTHAAPTALTDANTTLLWTTNSNYQLPSATLSADRTFTWGTSDSPPIGALMSATVESQSAFRALCVNGGVSGGNIVSGALAPGQNQAGTITARFDGVNWKLQTDPGRTQFATATTGGIITGTQFSQLANLVTTPVVSYSSGTPTLTLSANAPETLFYLSGTVSAPKLPAAGSNIGLRAIVKCENLSGCAVTADTGNPDLIDGSATYTVPGSYGSASYHFKATGIVRAFPGLT